jgi:tetratricopeptide (TPR) repeat protein
MHTKHLIFAAGMAFSVTVFASIPLEVEELQHEWARIKYQTPEHKRADAFEALAHKAEEVSAQNVGKAEPLVWEAIILSSEAGEEGGLGALSLVKKAKGLLEQAEKIKPDALHGSIYTSLGSLYYQVPGWPVGFGNDDKAREYLLKALKINPSGIDPNYFYGDFLMDQKDYKGAVKAFEKALAAPPRPNRQVADAGRRHEVEAALVKAREKLKHDS